MIARPAGALARAALLAGAVAALAWGACAGAPVSPGGGSSASAPVPAPPAADGLGPAARRAHAQCAQGRAEACAALGLALQEGRGVPHDEARAAAYFDRACALRRDPAAPACADLGALLLEGVGLDHDRARARALFQAGCDAGYGRACAALGYAGRDPAAATPRFRRACELGSGWGCYLWAQSREAAAAGRGAAAGGRGDLLEIYATGCANRYPAACAAAGRLGLSMIERAEPHAPTARACATWLLEACQGGEARGCARLGRLLQRGAPGLPANPSQAAQLLDAACGAGDASACPAAPPGATGAP